MRCPTCPPPAVLGLPDKLVKAKQGKDSSGEPRGGHRGDSQRHWRGLPGAQSSSTVSPRRAEQKGAGHQRKGHAYEQGSTKEHIGSERPERESWCGACEESDGSEEVAGADMTAQLLGGQALKPL